jgi:tetratricopeptide (TPR) repeat protein
MQQAIHHHNQTDDAAPLQVRIGLHVGEPIQAEHDYFGTPVVIAKRLCDQAAGGQILLSNLVRELAGTRGGYTFVDRGALSLKGLAQPLPAWELILEPGASPDASLVPPSTAATPALAALPVASLPPPPLLVATAERERFVGRGDELAQLRQVWERARAGARQVVMIGGEPGIGKTRLTLEFARAVHAEGATVLLGHCDEETLTPYQPFVEALRYYVTVCPPDELRAQAPLTGRAELARLVPELAQRLPDLGASVAGDPEGQRYRLFEAVAALLAAAANAHPLLLILDDVHWADKASLLLLRHIARAATPAALCIAGAYRDTEVDRAHPLAATLAGLRRESMLTRVALGGMPEADVAGVIAGWLGAAPPAELTRTVFDETEGNPLFVQEVLRHLDESGLMRAGDTLTAEQLGIPEGVHEVIARRLARLSEASNRALQHAAILGREWEFDVLAAMAGMDDEILLVAVEDALSAQLLLEARGRNAAVYAFSHALVRQTLEEDLSLPRRQRLHRQAAEAIERVHARDLDRYLGPLAAHYRLAGGAADPGRAIVYARRAAGAAAAVFAWEEAVGHLQAALERSETGDAAARCDLLLDLGDVLMAAREPMRVVEEIAPAAYALAEELNDGDRATRACFMARQALFVFGGGAVMAAPALRAWAERTDRWAAPGTVRRVRADLAVADARHGLARFGEAWTLRHRALALGRELGDVDGVWDAVVLLVGMMAAPRLEPVCRDLADEFGRASRNHVGIRHYGRLPFYLGLTFLSWGDRERAEAAWREAHDLAARTRDPQLGVLAGRCDILRALVDGELAMATGYGLQLIADAAEWGSPVAGWFWSVNTLFRPLLHLGRAAQALDLLTPPESARTAGIGVIYPPQMPPSALMLAHLGRHEEARRELHALMFELDAAGPRADLPTAALLELLEAAVLTADGELAGLLAGELEPAAALSLGGTSFTCPARHLGAAAALLGRPEEARRYYQQALESAGRIGFRPETALTQLELAALLLEHYPADRAAALTYLARAGAEFEAMGMRPALERAAHLRDRFGVTRTD